MKTADVVRQGKIGVAADHDEILVQRTDLAGEWSAPLVVAVGIADPGEAATAPGSARIAAQGPVAADPIELGKPRFDDTYLEG